MPFQNVKTACFVISIRVLSTQIRTLIAACRRLNSVNSFTVVDGKEEEEDDDDDEEEEEDFS